MNTIGERIKELRCERGLSRKTVCEEIHISYSTLAKYENGERLPNIYTLIAIADVFEISLDELVGRNQYIAADNHESKMVSEIINLLLNIEPDDLQLIYTTIMRLYQT